MRASKPVRVDPSLRLLKLEIEYINRKLHLSNEGGDPVAEQLLKESKAIVVHLEDLQSAFRPPYGDRPRAVYSFNEFVNSIRSPELVAVKKRLFYFPRLLKLSTIEELEPGSTPVQHLLEFRRALGLLQATRAEVEAKIAISKRDFHEAYEKFYFLALSLSSEMVDQNVINTPSLYANYTQLLQCITGLTRHLHNGGVPADETLRLDAPQNLTALVEMSKSLVAMNQRRPDLKMGPMTSPSPERARTRSAPAAAAAVVPFSETGPATAAAIALLAASEQEYTRVLRIELESIRGLLISFHDNEKILTQIENLIKNYSSSTENERMKHVQAFIRSVPRFPFSPELQTLRNRLLLFPKLLQLIDKEPAILKQDIGSGGENSYIITQFSALLSNIDRIKVGKTVASDRSEKKAEEKSEDSPQKYVLLDAYEEFYIQSVRLALRIQNRHYSEKQKISIDRCIHDCLDAVNKQLSNNTAIPIKLPDNAPSDLVALVEISRFMLSLHTLNIRIDPMNNTPTSQAAKVIVGNSRNLVNELFANPNDKSTMKAATQITGAMVALLSVHTDLRTERAASQNLIQGLTQITHKKNWTVVATAVTAAITAATCIGLIATGIGVGLTLLATATILASAIMCVSTMAATVIMSHQHAHPPKESMRGVMVTVSDKIPGLFNQSSHGAKSAVSASVSAPSSHDSRVKVLRPSHPRL